MIQKTTRNDILFTFSLTVFPLWLLPFIFIVRDHSTAFIRRRFSIYDAFWRIWTRKGVPITGILGLCTRIHVHDFMSHHFISNDISLFICLSSIARYQPVNENYNNKYLIKLLIQILGILAHQSSKCCLLSRPTPKIITSSTRCANKITISLRKKSLSP